MVTRIKTALQSLDRGSNNRVLPRIARRALSGFVNNEALQYAGSMAYFAVISLFQMLVLAVIGLSFFMDAGVARAFVIEQVVLNSPIDAQTVDSVLDGVIKTRGGITILSIAFLTWSGLGAFSALSTGVGRAFVAVPKRGFVAEKLIGLLLISLTGFLAIASLLAGLAARALQELVTGRLHLIPGGSFGLQAVGFLLPVVLILVAFYLVYRLVPNRKVGRRAALIGALAATGLWTALRFGFTFYATEVARYDSAFGPISTAITLLVFLYFASVIVLLGAEITHATLADQQLPTQSSSPDLERQLALPLSAGSAEEPQRTPLAPLAWLGLAAAAFALGWWRGRSERKRR